MIWPPSKIYLSDRQRSEQARRRPPSVVEERDAVRDRIHVFHQPVVELAADAGRELADEAQRHRGREYSVVEQDQLEVTQPLDAPELAQQVEVCYTWNHGKYRNIESLDCTIKKYCTKNSPRLSILMKRWRAK